MSETGNLLNKLLPLTPGQFEVLLEKLSVPRHYLPGANSEQAIRVTGLMQWAKSPGGCGLAAIETALAEMAQTVTRINSITSTDREREMERLKHIEDMLDLYNEQLRDFEKSRAIADAAERSRLKQRIRIEILPEIKKYELQKIELLTSIVVDDDVPVNEAEVVEGELVTAIESIQQSHAETRSDEAMRLIQEIHAKLMQPGKTAVAKLKVAIPLLPLVRYEMELDSESGLVRIFNKATSLLKRKPQNPQ